MGCQLLVALYLDPRAEKHDDNEVLGLQHLIDLF